MTTVDSNFYDDIGNSNNFGNPDTDYYNSQEYLEEKEWKNLLDLFAMLLLEFVQISVSFGKRFTKFFQQMLELLETNAFLKSLQFKIFNPSNFLLFTVFLKKLISELKTFFESGSDFDYTV